MGRECEVPMKPLRQSFLSSFTKDSGSSVRCCRGLYFTNMVATSLSFCKLFYNRTLTLLSSALLCVPPREWRWGWGAGFDPLVPNRKQLKWCCMASEGRLEKAMQLLLACWSTFFAAGGYHVRILTTLGPACQRPCGKTPMEKALWPTIQRERCLPALTYPSHHMNATACKTLTKQFNSSLSWIASTQKM